MKNAKPSAENGNPNIAPENAMNRGQRRPSSNESEVPDTAPTANRIPKALDQRRARVSQTSSCVLSQSPSAASISSGRPAPKTPNTEGEGGGGPLVPPRTG